MHRVFPIRHAGWLLSPLRRVTESPARLLSPYVRTGDTVIDLGCGPGFFTLPMAEMVGENGSVIAIDVQEEMLSMLRGEAEERGLLSHIHLHLCRGDSLALEREVHASFALAFHVLHETEDVARMLSELHDAMGPGARLLVAEPIFEVGKNEFRETIRKAERAGFRYLASPFVFLSRTALMERV